MFLMSTIAIMVTMLMAIIRGLRGPTVYDRALAVNMFGTATVLLISVLGFLTGRPEFLDLALLYALLSFIGTIAVLKYVAARNLGVSQMDRGDEEDKWNF